MPKQARSQLPPEGGGPKLEKVDFFQGGLESKNVDFLVANQGNISSF